MDTWDIDGGPIGWIREAEGIWKWRELEVMLWFVEEWQRGFGRVEWDDGGRSVGDGEGMRQQTRRRVCHIFHSFTWVLNFRVAADPRHPLHSFAIWGFFSFFSLQRALIS